jgi:hypothetical protein
MATGFNLAHAQVAAKEAVPTFSDINLASTFDPSVDQDSQTLRGDGRIGVTTYSSREGTGSITFGSVNLSTVAIMTGDEFSSDGVAGTDLVDRLDISGSTTPPSLIFSSWIYNVDRNFDWAGQRVTVTNASVSVPSTSYEQESWTEYEASMTFSDNEDGVMMIWETMEVAPTFTAGVMPVALVPPTP